MTNTEVLHSTRVPSGGVTMTEETFLPVIYSLESAP